MHDEIARRVQLFEDAKERDHELETIDERKVESVETTEARSIHKQSYIMAKS